MSVNTGISKWARKGLNEEDDYKNDSVGAESTMP